MLEYAPDQILISVKLRDLIVVENWQVTGVITDSNLSNIDKCWLQLMPGFSIEVFPFVIASGKDSINLVNLKEFSQEPLILA